MARWAPIGTFESIVYYFWVQDGPQKMSKLRHLTCDHLKSARMTLTIGSAGQEIAYEFLMPVSFKEESSRSSIFGKSPSPSSSFGPLYLSLVSPHFPLIGSLGPPLVERHPGDRDSRGRGSETKKSGRRPLFGWRAS